MCVRLTYRNIDNIMSAKIGQSFECQTERIFPEIIRKNFVEIDVKLIECVWFFFSLSQMFLFRQVSPLFECILQTSQ